MELGAVHPPRPHRTGDRDGIIADGKGAFGAVFAVVAVDVVHILALADVPEQRIVLYDVQSVPAHLRHLQLFVRKVGPQRADLAFDKAQPGVLAVFVAFFKQQLHTKADAQQGLALGLLFQHRHKTGGGKLCHGIPERAHSRQDKPVCGAEDIGVGGDHCLQPQLL